MVSLQGMRKCDSMPNQSCKNGPEDGGNGDDEELFCSSNPGFETRMEEDDGDDEEEMFRRKRRSLQHEPMTHKRSLIHNQIRLMQTVS